MLDVIDKAGEPKLISVDFGSIEKRVIASLTKEATVPTRKAVEFVPPNTPESTQRVIPSVSIFEGDVVLHLQFEGSEHKTSILYIDNSVGQIRLFNVGEDKLAEFGLLSQFGGRVKVKEYPGTSPIA